MRFQRFAWDVARNFMLTAGGPPRRGATVRPGALAGGRHIGHLMRILEAAHVTPDRYSVRSLSDALGRLTRSGAASALAPDQQRDRIAYFAWLLRRLNAAEPGETVLERTRREAAERAAQRARRLKAARARDSALERDHDHVEAAAAAFFADARRRRRPHTHAAHDASVRLLVDSVIGPGRRLYDAPAAVQVLVGRLTQLHRTLAAVGWSLDCSPTTVRWTREGDSVTMPLRRHTDAVDLDRNQVRGVLPEGFVDLGPENMPDVAG